MGKWDAPLHTVNDRIFMIGTFHLLTGVTVVHSKAFAGVGEDLAAVDGNRRIASPMDAITSGEFEDLMEGVGEEVFFWCLNQQNES